MSSSVVRLLAVSALAAAAPNATLSACAALAAREFDLLAFTRVMKTGSSSLLASLPLARLLPKALVKKLEGDTHTTA